eukprot:2691428-Pyramimonas_sp.AAC.1
MQVVRGHSSVPRLSFAWPAIYAQRPPILRHSRMSAHSSRAGALLVTQYIATAPSVVSALGRARSACFQRR